MATGAPDEKFQKLREENEKRRKKKEEEEKRRKAEEELKGKVALERRRQERLEQDERMRKPWQQPPAPKKPILRKGAKQKPVQPTSPGVDPVRLSQADDKRREWRQGLQDFIKQQRQQAVTAAPKAAAGAAAGPGGRQHGAAEGGGGPVVPLTWEELRMAAEAGFDELLRQQELQAAEEPQSRATRHRSPYKSPFKGAPAPPLATVQVALVPTHNDNIVTAAAAGSGTGAGSGPGAAAARRAAAAAASQAVGAGKASAAGPVHTHGNSGAGFSDATAGAAAASAAAALRNSYKFSDAPGWIGGFPATTATSANGVGVGSGPVAGAVAAGATNEPRTPAAVLYPPPATATAAVGADTPGDEGNSWADDFVGLAGDGHSGGSGNSVGGSVASSGGLRRGVTAVARHRAAPLDAASLDLLPTDPAAAGGGVRSPRGSGQHRLPLPGPYDSPSQQQWPPSSPSGGRQDSVSAATHGTIPAGAAGGVGGGSRRPTVGPLADDPLEASLMADGTLAALQQSDGFRLSSPRSSGAWQPPQAELQPARASQSGVAPRDYVTSQQDTVDFAQQLMPPPQQHAQPQPAKQEQRHQRKGWGVPVQPPVSASGPESRYDAHHPGSSPDLSPAPPWAAGTSSNGASAQVPQAAVPSPAQAGDEAPAAESPAGGFIPARSGDGHGLSARSPAAVRHSVGVGESGGLDMWQRESVPLMQQLHPAPQSQSPAVLPAQNTSQGVDADAPLMASPPVPPLTTSPLVAPAQPRQGTLLGEASPPQPFRPPGPLVDASADLVRFSSPPGPSRDPSSSSPGEPPPEALQQSPSLPDPEQSQLDQLAQLQRQVPAEALYGGLSMLDGRPAVGASPVKGLQEAAGTGTEAGGVDAPAPPSEPPSSHVVAASPHPAMAPDASGPHPEPAAAASTGDAGASASLPTAALPPHEVSGGGVQGAPESGVSLADATTQLLTASGSKHPAQQQPAALLPPIAPLRASASSMKASHGAFTAAGASSAPAPAPLPPLAQPSHPAPAPAQPPAMATAKSHPPPAVAVAAATEARDSVAVPSQKQPASAPPHQPPIRSPSPPASPPRRSTSSQRFHRQLSGSSSLLATPSAVAAGSSGTAAAAGGGGSGAPAPLPRPVSADGCPIAAAATPAAPPSRQEEQQQPQQQQHHQASQSWGTEPLQQVLEPQLPAISQQLPSNSQQLPSRFQQLPSQPVVQQPSAVDSTIPPPTASPPLLPPGPGFPAEAATAMAAAPVPASPRMPGVVVATPASPSRCAPAPATASVMARQEQQSQPQQHPLRLHGGSHQQEQQLQQQPQQSQQALAQSSESEPPVAVVALRASSGQHAGGKGPTGIRGSDPPVVPEEPSEDCVAPRQQPPSRARTEVEIEVEGGGEGEEDADVELCEEGEEDDAYTGARMHDASVLDSGRFGTLGHRPQQQQQQLSQQRREVEEDAVEPVEEGEDDAEEEAVRTSGSAPGSRGMDSSFERPPGTAEGSIITGSHVSARPWSGPSSLGAGAGGSTRPGSAYQTSSLLDDSVSSFDFRMRSAAASRPASAVTGSTSCSPLVRPLSAVAAAAAAGAAEGSVEPASLLYPPQVHGQRQDEIAPRAPPSGNGSPTVASVSKVQAPPEQQQQQLATAGTASEEQHVRRSSGMHAQHAGPRQHQQQQHHQRPQHQGYGVPTAGAANTFQVLQRPGGVGGIGGAAGYGDLYGSSFTGGDASDGGGSQPPFVEEPVVDGPEQQQRPISMAIAGRSTHAVAGVQQAAAGHTPVPSPGAAGVPAGGVPLPTFSLNAADTSAPAAATATAAVADPDLEVLLREIQELSALRKALKAEFEIMGHGEAVAGLGTLSVNTLTEVTTAAAGAQQQQQPPVSGTWGGEIAMEGDVGGSSHGAVLAPPAPAPLLQWGIPASGSRPGGTAQTQPPMPPPLVAQPEPPPQHRTPQQHRQQVQQPLLQWGPPAPMQPAQQPAPVVFNSSLAPADQVPPTVTLGPATQMPFLAQVDAPLAVTTAAPLPPEQGAPFAWSSQGPAGQPTAAEDPNGRSFAFSPALLGPQGAEMQLGLLPVAPPVLPGPAQAPPPPPAAALQWTVPVSGGAGPGAAFQSPTRPARVSGGSGGVAAASPGGALQSAGSTGTPRKAASRKASGAGSYAAPAVESPSGGKARTAHLGSSGTAHLTAAAAAAAAGAAPAERPLINEGSYAVAAVQARERAERERAAREALQAEAAAAKAAAAQRSKSERSAAAAAAAAAAGQVPSAASNATAGKTAGVTREAAPLGLKAPSTIGSYVRQPSPSPSKPQARPSAATGAAAIGRGAGGGIGEDGLATPDSTADAASAKQAWGTPTAAPASRIPTPPRTSTVAASTASATSAKPPIAQPPSPAREDSLSSDLDFLERASDIFDSETDSPERSSPPQPQTAVTALPPRREAFPSPATAAAAVNSVYRERLAEARPQPLRIPSSAAATPMGGASTASTVASRAVPTGGRGRPGGAAAGGGRAGRSGAAGGTGGKPATPFTTAIRELMGLPGSAPLEQSRAAAGQQQQGRSDPRVLWPGRLTEEEDKLLASLQRLDGDILKRGLVAAGLINDPQGEANGHNGQAAASAATASAKGAAKGAAAAGKSSRPGAAPGGVVASGGGGGGGGGRNAALTNSMQQDQLRESLERLDSRLGLLRRKMEDRACTLGMPSATLAGGAAVSPSGVSAAGVAAAASAKRDPTPTRDDRRGPPATLAKSRTPTPNKAKAIRDQRQQQLSAIQGPTPPPARAPAAAAAVGPPKPSSAPVMATLGGTAMDAHLTLGQNTTTTVAGGHVAAAVAAAGQPYGMPPRAPPAKAPASAPSGPAAANAAQQQQQQQAAAGMMMPPPYGMMLGGAMPYGGMMPNGAVAMYGMPSAGVNGQQQPQPQPQEQQQVAYVPAMLPNGQMAYVPQFVSPGAASQGFPGFYPGPQSMGMGLQGAGHQPQPPPLMVQMSGGAGFPGGMVMQPHQQQHQQQSGGPMLAWGAATQSPAAQGPQAVSAYGMPSPSHAQQYGGGGNSGGSVASPAAPSLYSFERTGSGAGGVQYGGLETRRSSGGGGQGLPLHQQQQHQQQLFQAPPAALPFTLGPPPSGPMPHYHRTVMRSRSIGSRDGEAVAAAAAAVGLMPQSSAAAAAAHPHHQIQHPQQQQQPHGVLGHPQAGPQQPSMYYQQQQQQQQTGFHPSASQQPLGQMRASENQYLHPEQMASQPHPVQVQSFGPNAHSSRGLGMGGATGPWGSGMGGGAGAGSGGAGGEDAGVIKAVNLGLLLS